MLGRLATWSAGGKGGPSRAQATAVETTKQGIALLEALPEAYDLVLKQHDPAHKIDAARLLLQLKASDVVALRSIPVIGENLCARAAESGAVS